MNPSRNLPSLHIPRGRPALRVGTHGTIRARQAGDCWVAETYLRDPDGQRRSIRRKAPTKAAAIAVVQAAVAARPGFGALAEARKPRISAAPPENPSCSRPHDVYRFFDAVGVLLYVGISLSSLRRFGQHRVTKDWWLEVDAITITHYSDHDAARAAEQVAIATENPRYNIAA